VVCPLQPVSPTALYSRRPTPSVWAPGYDSLRLHIRVPTAHARVVLLYMNGPVVFWGQSRVPKDYREGGRTPSASDRIGQGGSGYLSNSGTRSPPCAPQRCQSLMGSGGAVL
ncbi:unnamed protein product, partial [Staurois parvus]